MSTLSISNPTRFHEESVARQATNDSLRHAMPDTATSPIKKAGGLPVPSPGFKRLEPTPGLLDDLRSASRRLEGATPEEIIAWGVEHYAPYLTMATAFGPEG